ncbi:hypothetical protein [Microbacterium lemovicicum]|uniref:hypothetical protein n=1 Tax=Microbacterium lemovicicum TaxID=1072463 RepID=UPI000F8CBAF4|nr:hypothetical protein [Microbacterium lemovicicum]
MTITEWFGASTVAAFFAPLGHGGGGLLDGLVAVLEIGDVEFLDVDLVVLAGLVVIGLGLALGGRLAAVVFLAAGLAAALLAGAFFAAADVFVAAATSSVGTSVSTSSVVRVRVVVFVPAVTIRLSPADGRQRVPRSSSDTSKTLVKSRGAEMSRVNG